MNQIQYCQPPTIGIKPFIKPPSSAYSMPSFKNTTPTLEFLILKTAEKTGISIEDIKSKLRHKEIVKARKIFIYNSVTLTKTTYVNIGYFINKNHSTITNAMQVAKIDIDTYGEKELYNLGI